MPKSAAAAPAAPYNVWRQSQDGSRYNLVGQFDSIARAKSTASYYSVSAPPVVAAVSGPKGCVARYYDGRPLKFKAAVPAGYCGMAPFSRFNDAELKAFTSKASGSFSFLEEHDEGGVPTDPEQFTMLRCTDAFGDPCWLRKVAVFPLVNMDWRLKAYTFQYMSWWPH